MPQSLSAQSSIIKDMLQVSNPKQNEMHEGVPVVHFSVEPSSMAIFLTFFYQPLLIFDFLLLLTVIWLIKRMHRIDSLTPDDQILPLNFLKFSNLPI